MIEETGREPQGLPEQRQTSEMFLLFSVLGGCHLPGVPPCCWWLLVGQETWKNRSAECWQNHTECALVSVAPHACIQQCRMEQCAQGAAALPDSIPPLCVPVWDLPQPSPCLHDTKPKGCFCCVCSSRVHRQELSSDHGCPCSLRPSQSSFTVFNG